MRKVFRKILTDNNVDIQNLKYDMKNLRHLGQAECFAREVERIIRKNVPTYTGTISLLEDRMIKAERKINELMWMVKPPKVIIIEEGENVYEEGNIMNWLPFDKIQTHMDKLYYGKYIWTRVKKSSVYSLDEEPTS